MKKLLVIAAALLISISSFAQNYDKAIGLRIGSGVGITYKQFLNPGQAIEANLGLNELFSNDNLNLVVGANYQFHFDVNVPGLTLYAGPGASLGLFLGEHNDFLLSIDGIGGIEYKFNNVPIALSLDWKPQLQLISDVHFRATNFGLGVKYTF